MHQPTPARSQRPSALIPLIAALLFAAAWSASAQTIQPPYDSVYTLTDLGRGAGIAPAR